MLSLPWLSFGLLVAAYSTFSWFLHETTDGLVVWGLAIAFALFQALLLTAFSDRFRAVIDAWLKSDVGYFTTVVIAALFVAFAFVWFRIFSYLLMIIAAEMLARLDLQRAGFSRFQSLVILTVLSFAGLLTGWVISQYLPA
ncbi:MAG: hypothetical protein VKK04_07920 [Synechococcales bacterium]|nr:hypothetical protein [Synechococcales bacterium]